MKHLGFTTCLLHLDRFDGVAHGGVHHPVHNSVAFGHKSAEDLVATFQGRLDAYAYSRQSNPTVNALEHRISVMEDGLSSLAFSTGMAAIGSMLFALLRQGDHVVVSQHLFGNTVSLFDSFASQGLSFSFVDATDVRNVASAINEDTKMIFVETIANPRTQIADLEAIGELCRAKNILYVVDNTMTSPWLFRPTSVHASLVVNSLTKYLSGHGHVLGGVITNTGHFDWEHFPNIQERYRKGEPSSWGLRQIRKKGLRDFGATLSPQAAHDIVLGTETLALRMSRACENAMALAKHLEAHSKVAQVYYPGLSSHPQHARAKSIFRGFGALFGFDLVPGTDPIAVLNRLQVVIRSTNLGDNRTLAIPVAHTIYYEMGEERRATMGIKEGLIRISVGIEDLGDLVQDFDKALAD